MRAFNAGPQEPVPRPCRAARGQRRAASVREECRGVAAPRRRPVEDGTVGRRCHAARRPAATPASIDPRRRSRAEIDAISRIGESRVEDRVGDVLPSSRVQIRQDRYAAFEPVVAEDRREKRRRPFGDQPIERHEPIDRTAHDPQRRETDRRSVIESWNLIGDRDWQAKWSFTQRASALTSLASKDVPRSLALLRSDECAQPLPRAGSSAGMNGPRTATSYSGGEVAFADGAARRIRDAKHDRVLRIERLDSDGVVRRQLHLLVHAGEDGLDGDLVVGRKFRQRVDCDFVLADTQDARAPLPRARALSRRPHSSAASQRSARPPLRSSAGACPR